MKSKTFRIEVLTPCEFVKKIRDALNEAGACRLGNYDMCISYSEVKGYWRPLPGSKPYDGKIGEISHGKECRLVTICEEKFLKKAISAIKKVHPYETPHIDIIALQSDII